MKTLKIVCLKIVCLWICMGLMAACSPIYGVRHDYSLQTDFSRYRSYDWMPAPKNAGMDELVAARVKKAVDAELSTKGLKRNTQDPDFQIAEHLGKKNKVQVEEWGYGYYGPFPGYWGPGGISTYDYEEGSLILDFVDAESKKLIWRGSAKAEVQHVNSPEKSQKLITEAVKKILEKYPPSAQ